MNLIISDNKELWNYKNNILLGSWCLNQKSIFDLNNKNYEIINYHWADKKKLKKDLEYLKKIHNFFSKQLRIILNNYFDKKNSLKYYEILLSKWLWRFVLFNFDRWEIVRLLNKRKNKTSAKIYNFNEEKFIPYSTYDFCTETIFSNDWNHWVFSKILKEQKTCKLISLNKKLKNPKLINSKINNEYIKKRINKFLNFFSSQEIFAQNMSFSKIGQILFNLRFRQFRIPYNDKSNIINENKIDLNLRNRLFLKKNNKNNEKFVNFLFKQLVYNFPKVFLENFHENKIKLENLFLPKSPKVIMTSMDHHFNDLFNLYAAEKVEKKSKLFIFQHGGSYGLTDNFTAEHFDTLISDKFITWGWKNSKKTKPFYAQKYFFKKEILEIKKRVGIVLPTTEFKKCPGDIGGGRPRYKDEIDMHIKDIIKFIAKLDKKHQSKTYVKYLVTRDTDYIKKSISNSFPNLKLITSKKNTYKMNFKIAVETLNSTGFLDAMYLNHPVILLLNENFSNIRHSVISDFNMLKKLKIVHFNSLSAANFINKNYENLENWWFGKNLQSFRKKFCNKFAKKSKRPLADIRNII